MSRLVLSGVVSLLFLMTHSVVHGLERFDIVTTNELKTMLDKRKAGKEDFILVNTLDSLIHRHHSIPGSINIPWSRTREMSDKLGSDKEKLIVTYCMGYR